MKSVKFFCFFLVLMSLSFLLTGCRTAPRRGKPKVITILTTGYCKCKKCTGWKRNWLLKPVYTYGKMKGKRKKIGATSDGSKAKGKIIAADTAYYPYGTVFYIPYYGYGEVHDIGGKIKGSGHIDLLFSSHSKALKWGTRKLTVKVWNNKKN